VSGTLHLVSSASALPECLPLCRPGDHLLLLGDGVYALNGTPAWPAGIEVHALDADCRARGLLGRIGNAVRPVTMNDFVELVVRTQRSVSWAD
jgi:sulfur relay protein TusB/DsrH